MTRSSSKPFEDAIRRSARRSFHLPSQLVNGRLLGRVWVNAHIGSGVRG